MRAKTFMPIAFGLIAAIAVGFAWRESRRAAEFTAERQALADQRVQLDAGTRQASDRETAAGNRTTELRTALEAFAQTAEPKPAANVAPERTRAVTQSEVLANDPRVQALSLAEQRATAADRYAMFFRTAGLSPAQIEQFLDTMTRRDAQTMDLRHTAQAQGLADNDPSLGKLTAQMWNDYNTAQQELLGPAGQQQLREFERSTAVRMMMSELAGAATVAGVPFTTAQLDQLAQVFATSAGAAPNRPVDVRKIDWTQVDRLAQAILSPEQMEFFTTNDPDGIGGRYTLQFRRATDAAAKADAQLAAPKKPAGGS